MKNKSNAPTSQMDLSVINEGQGKLGDGQKAKRIASRQKMINDDLPAY